MKALVVGYGSIGTRHVRLLDKLLSRVAVVSNRDIDYPIRYIDIPSAIMNEQPDYVVIANRTSEHYKSLLELSECNYRGVILVEKPLFNEYLVMPLHNFRSVFVGFNLRFHPVIKELAKLVMKKKIISVQCYAGQYLPTWRPDRDYRVSYSAQKELGGGVLRDLSHELDYLNWVLGGWQSIVSVGGNFSNMDINSDDVYSVMMTTKNCPVVNLQLNYLDRNRRREIIINGYDYTIKADLVNNRVQFNDNVIDYSVDSDLTYIRQHEAIIAGDYGTVCSFNEGLNVVKMIHCIELSAKQKEWIYNE